MAKRKADSLESRLIAACLEESRCVRTMSTSGCVDTFTKAQIAMYALRSARAEREAAADALLAEREKGGKG